MASRTRAIPQPLQIAFAAHLKEWVEREHAGNQSSAGRALGFTQGHIGAVMHGTRGPGLEMAYALKLKTGKSLDELFGLVASAPPVSRAESEADRLERVREEVLSALAELRAETSRRKTPQGRSPHDRKDRT